MHPCVYLGVFVVRMCECPHQFAYVGSITVDNVDVSELQIIRQTNVKRYERLTLTQTQINTHTHKKHSHTDTHLLTSPRP